MHCTGGVICALSEHEGMAAVLIGRYAKPAGHENVIAGSDCGFGTLVGTSGGRSTWYSPSSRPWQKALRLPRGNSEHDYVSQHS